MTGRRPDRDALRHEGQLKVQVADLRRNLGSRLEVQRSAVLEDLAAVDCRVPPGGVIEVDLVLDAVSDGLVASGTVGVPWEGTCRRCLGPGHRAFGASGAGGVHARR